MRSRSARIRIERRPESGYAVLMALFLVATLLLIVTVATPNLLLQGRRDREDDAVWRGKQYVRAIRLYFQKNGRYPATLEDLTKPGPANVHFLRKVYTDPMNRADGTWRAIYMAPNGQLTGSVRYHSLQEMAAAQGFAAPMIAQQGAAQQGVSPTAGAQPAAGQPGAAGTGMAQGAGGLSALSSSSAAPGTPVPLQAVDGPVMGGLVIGVGSKVKEPSIRVYQGGESYFQWEFIFNPLTTGGQLPGATAPAAGTTATGQPATGQPATGQPATGQPASAPPITTTTPANPSGGLSSQ